MMYSKRRTNLGRRSKKSYNRKLKRFNRLYMRGGSAANLEDKKHNFNWTIIPEGYSQHKTNKQYPKGTTVLVLIAKNGIQDKITLSKPSYLGHYYLGNEVIGIQLPAPTVSASNSEYKPKSAAAANRQNELEEKKEYEAHLKFINKQTQHVSKSSTGRTV